jgi:hypothetical protein
VNPFRSQRTIKKKIIIFDMTTLRSRKLENLVTTGKIKGRRDRGKQRKMILYTMGKKWHGINSTTEVIACV